MPDSMDVSNVNPLTRPAPIARPDQPQRSAPGGKDFKTVLLESLNQVNDLQQEATAGVERLATGETENMAVQCRSQGPGGVWAADGDPEQADGRV